MLLNNRAHFNLKRNAPRTFGVASFDRTYLVFGRMAELSGRSIIIGHEGMTKAYKEYVQKR